MFQQAKVEAKARIQRKSVLMSSSPTSRRSIAILPSESFLPTSFADDLVAQEESRQQDSSSRSSSTDQEPATPKLVSTESPSLPISSETASPIQPDLVVSDTKEQQDSSSDSSSSSDEELAKAFKLSLPSMSEVRWEDWIPCVYSRPKLLHSNLAPPVVVAIVPESEASSDD